MVPGIQTHTSRHHAGQAAAALPGSSLSALGARMLTRRLCQMLLTAPGEVPGPGEALLLLPLPARRLAARRLRGEACSIQQRSKK
jgi:hypothetical protein